MSLKMFSMIMNYILLHLRCKLLWQTICNLDLVSYVLGHKGFTGSTPKSQGLWRSLRTLVTSGDVKMWKQSQRNFAQLSCTKRTLALALLGNRKKAAQKCAAFSGEQKGIFMVRKKHLWKWEMQYRTEFIDKDRNKNFQG